MANATRSAITKLLHDGANEHGPPYGKVSIGQRSQGMEEEGLLEHILHEPLLKEVRKMVSKEELKSLLRDLRSEADLSMMKERAEQLLRNVDPKVLSLAEQELMEEGMSQEELRRLCDLHLQLLSSNIAKAEAPMEPTHPIVILEEEHEIILKNLDDLEGVLERVKNSQKFDEIGEELKRLESIAHALLDAESHHEREEKALFPRLEKHGITGPPSIMRMEHIDLRKRKRAIGELVENRGNLGYGEFADKLQEVGNYILKVLREHIFKENNILYPAALESLNDDEWNEIKTEFDDIGYCCFTPRSLAMEEERSIKNLDLRKMPPPERHAKIFETWNSLGEGQTLRIINDHDPKPLHYQFEAEQEGRFEWAYEQSGPTDWIVKIKKIPKGSHRKDA